MSSSSTSAVRLRPMRVTPSATTTTRSWRGMKRVGSMSRRSRARLSRAYEKPVDSLCADQRDAGQREHDADALHGCQALVEQEVGECDGDDREQAAEHRDEAQKAAGGGDGERGVGPGV